jgi:hypothetical protein
MSNVTWIDENLQQLFEEAKRKLVEANMKKARKKSAKKKTLASKAVKKNNRSERKVSKDSAYLFPETGIDLSQATVSRIGFDVNNMELELKNTEILGMEPLSVLILRFEAIRGFEEFLFNFQNRLYEKHKGKWHKPNANLRTISIKESKQLYRYQVELAIAPRRNVETFRCKRVCVIGPGGAPIAGDSILPPPKWKKKDYREFAQKIGQWVEEGEYKQIHSSLHKSLTTKKTLAKLTEELDRWTRLRTFPKGGIESRGKTFSIDVETDDDGRDRLSKVPASLDPDIIRMCVSISFFNRFVWHLLLVEEHGKLQIGKYEFFRDF